MTTIKLRRGTASQWSAANPVLAAGEPGLETDTGKTKYGDGSTAWNALPYSTSDPDLSGLVPATRTVAGKPLSANVTLAKSDVGLGNVDNTADADKSVLYAAAAGSAGSAASATSATKLATARTIRTDLGSTSAVGFDGTGNVSPGVTGNLPVGNGGSGATTAAGARANLGVATYLGTAANQSAMTALTGNVGDWCVRTDLDSVFVLTALPATTAGNWTQPDPDLATKIHTATAASSLDDNDEFAIADAEADFGLKRIKWSVFKSIIYWVITYFFQNEATLLVNVSSAAITLTNQPALNVFTGSTARTWTLPPVADNTGKVIRIKNRASVKVTVNRAGTDQIYSTSTVTSVDVAAGTSLTLVNDGTYWVTN